MKGIGLYIDDFLVIKKENDLIKENITRILLTSPGERVMNPKFGSKLKSFIFENDNILKNDVVRNLKQSINRWEPRVDIKYINAEIKEVGVAEIFISLISKTTLEEFTYETIIKY